MLQPIDRSSTTDKVIENIISYIEDDNISIGDKLPSEYEIGNMLNVGRSSVREALRVLQTMGYVEVKHGRGAFVIGKNPSSENAQKWFVDHSYDLNDVYVVRNNIEPFMSSLAAQNRSEDDLSVMRHYLDEMASVISSSKGNNPQILARLDRCFHEAICHATQNSLLMTIYSGISSALEEYRTNAFAILENQANTLGPHEKIWESIRDQDPEKAAEEMRKHLVVSEQDMKQAAEVKNP